MKRDIQTIRKVMSRGQNFGVLDRRVSNELSNFLQLDPFGVTIGTSYKKTSNSRLDLVWNANSTNQLERLWNELEFVDLMDL